MTALDPGNGKGLGELGPLTGTRNDLADQIVAVLVNQIFQRADSDRCTVIARGRGLSQHSKELNRVTPAPLNRLVNQVAGSSGPR